jgi:hypothetical protein
LALNINLGAAMTKKIYTSAQGRTVDMGALMLQNETTRAVGNMQVNARGDKIDTHGRTLQSRVQQVNRHLKKQHGMAQTSPVPSSQKAVAQSTAAQSTTPIEENTELVALESSGINAAIDRIKKRK